MNGPPISRRYSGLHPDASQMLDQRVPTSNQTLLPPPSGSTPQDVATASRRSSPQPPEPESGFRGPASNGGPGSMTSTRTYPSVTTRRMISCEGFGFACVTAFETTSLVSSWASAIAASGKPNPMAATAARARAGAIGSRGSPSSTSDLMRKPASTSPCRYPSLRRLSGNPQNSAPQDGRGSEHRRQEAGAQRGVDSLCAQRPGETETRDTVDL